MNKNTFKGDHCLPFVMPDERSANIDKITDFLIAEYHIRNS
jgi:CMP-N-acetylneuraminic acid synthetase